MVGKGALVSGYFIFGGLSNFGVRMGGWWSLIGEPNWLGLKTTLLKDCPCYGAKRWLVNATGMKERKKKGKEEGNLEIQWNKDISIDNSQNTT